MIIDNNSDNRTNGELLHSIIAYPSLLGLISPERLKAELEACGYETLPLSHGALKGLPFEAGGGFKVVFGGDGLLQYHPKSFTHHDDEYYKISTGRGGTRRYDRNGKEKK